MERTKKVQKYFYLFGNIKFNFFTLKTHWPLLPFFRCPKAFHSSYSESLDFVLPITFLCSII